MWLAFLLRATFYCVEQPMWEGFDEWAHFAFIQHVAEHGTLPARTARASAEIAQSLELAPLPDAAAAGIAGRLTHDQFWKLAPGERAGKEAALRMLAFRGDANNDRNALPQYEAQQPPLYYVLLAPVDRVLDRRSLAAQVLALRLCSIAIGSLVVFLAYAIGAQVLGNRALALLGATLVACLPGLYIDVCRVGNESVAIAALSAMILVCLRVLKRGAGTIDWLVIGGVTGLALLTKAYALALLPVPMLAAIVRIARGSSRPGDRRGAWRGTAGRCALAYAVAAAIGGWWYVSTWRATGTLSGDVLDVAGAKFTFGQMLAAIPHVNWRAVADAGASSHVWIGGWSFLGVRRWMPRTFEAVALLGAIGLLVYAARAVGLVKSSRALWANPAVILIAAAAGMYLALAYHSFTTFLAKDLNASGGWYLYSVIVPEVVLFMAGLIGLFGKRWAAAGAAAVCVLAIAFDFYTMHFLLMPYYTGMIAHRANGSLETIQAADVVSHFTAMLGRLAINKPSGFGLGTIEVLWTAYLLASVALGVIAAVTARRQFPWPPSGGSGPVKTA